MKRPISEVILIMAAISCGVGLWAQDNPLSDGLALQDADQDPVYQILKNQQVDQGKQYLFAYPDVKGHQFLQNQVYREGSLTFDDVHYHEILLNYDIYNDLIITTMIRNGISKDIILDNSRIEQFRIGQDDFINIADSAGSVNPGIYKSILEKKEVRLLARIEKDVVGNNRSGEQLKKFVTRQTYLLLVGNESFKITSKKDLLRAFSGNQTMISTIQQSKIKFRNKTPDESALLRILQEI